MEKIDKIKDLIWEFDNGSQNAFEVIQKIKEVCNHNDETDKPKMRYKSNEEIAEMLIDIFDRIDIDIPNNFNEILEFVANDVEETADKENWHDGYVAIGFRRWIESNNDDKPKMRYKSNMKYFEVVQSILKSYHDAMDDKNSDLTCVPKMYVNKDYWVTKISVPYDMLGNRIDIELDDRTDTDYWGSLFYDEKSRDGIEFCVYQPEDSDGTPSLYLYPVTDGDIETSRGVQIECEIINNF